MSPVPRGISPQTKRTAFHGVGTWLKGVLTTTEHTLHTLQEPRAKGTKAPDVSPPLSLPSLKLSLVVTWVNGDWARGSSHRE